MFFAGWATELDRKCASATTGLAIASLQACRHLTSSGRQNILRIGSRLEPHLTRNRCQCRSC